MTTIHPYRIMLVISESAHLDSWVRLAQGLSPLGEELVMRGLVTVPEGTSLSEGAVAARNLRDALDPYARQYDFVNDQVRVHVDYQPMMRVLEELQDDSFDLLLVQWAGPHALTGGILTDQILQLAPCDVALLCGEGWDTAGPVLLSLRGGPNLTLGVRLARALAGASDITLFHAAESQLGAPDLKLLMRAESKIARTVTAVSSIAEGIIREAAGHKAIVIGASFAQPDAASSMSGTIVQRVFNANIAPVALVRARRPESVEFHMPMLPRAEEDVSTRVDRWFAENTFHSSEFADLEALLTLKEKQGLTISVALPALNEEETVGRVISTLKGTLMDAIPLVDEMVLIDSDSSDNTVAIAESFGIPVYKHPEILPELGSVRGKGEALWKSLYVTKGDIVAWVDTDITNIHPRFIYGLLGPLLKYPQVQYVKGFYQRPIKVGDKMQAYGGGRVTELVARPLLNLFYPELSGVIQPLSGEYAGRRSALERVPFFTGYGVETGLLIDLLDRYGLEGIAQTDLEMRIHHNQPLVGLSKMSFAILQVFIARLENRYSVQLLERANRSMKLIIHEPDRFALEIEEIGDLERPPMITVPAYRERNGLVSA